MDYEIVNLTYQEAVDVGNARYDINSHMKVFLQECGLMSKKEEGYYFSSVTLESHLYVVDKKKWMLTKLKYGI